MDILQTLAIHPLFEEVETPSLKRLLEESEHLSVRRGEAIYTPQSFRRCLGILLSGRVRVSKETLIVSVLSAKDVFGAAALFSEEGGYATTLTALTDCELLLLPREPVLRMVREEPRFAENYIRYLSERIGFLSDRLDAVSAGTAEGKLAQFLLSVAGEDGRVIMTATQFSARIGVGRATLYRAFETLTERGAIAREGKAIRVLDRKLLEPQTNDIS